MKTLIKILCLVISVLLVISLCACGDKKENIDSIEDITGEIANLDEQISEMAEENSKVKVGKYEVPADSDFEWAEVEGGVAITGYTGTITAVQIPEKLSGKKVVEIGSEAFSMTSVIGVKIPDTVAIISANAFLYCVALVEVEFGAGTKTLGNNVFEGCSALKNVSLNDGLETIGEMAFCWTSSLNEIEFPATLQSICRGAFCMSGIKNVVVPSNVEEISEYAFQECKNLKKVEIQDGVSVIRANAFDNCTEIESIIVPDSVNLIEDQAFNRCNSLTIHASSGSEAEKHATIVGINFKAS